MKRDETFYNEKSRISPQTSNLLKPKNNDKTNIYRTETRLPKFLDPHSLLSLYTLTSTKLPTRLESQSQPVLPSTESVGRTQYDRGRSDDTERPVVVTRDLTRTYYPKDLLPGGSKR